MDHHFSLQNKAYSQSMIIHCVHAIEYILASLRRLGMAAAYSHCLSSLWVRMPDASSYEHVFDMIYIVRTGLDIT